MGNYGVPSHELDEYGLLRFFESNRIQVCVFRHFPVEPHTL